MKEEESSSALSHDEIFLHQKIHFERNTEKLVGSPRSQVQVIMAYF